MICGLTGLTRLVSPKKAIFRVMSMVGMVLGAVGTLLSNWADDREMDITIEEKIDERLAARESEEESEEP